MAHEASRADIKVPCTLQVWCVLMGMSEGIITGGGQQKDAAKDWWQATWYKVGGENSIVVVVDQWVVGRKEKKTKATI